MSKFRKCDICGKEISYSEGDKPRGLIYGPYFQSALGRKSYSVRNSDDIEFEDVCSDCINKVVDYIKIIKGVENE